VLTYTEYWARVSNLLEMDNNVPEPNASLMEHLGFDSLLILEMIVVSEGLAQIEMPSPEIPLLTTANDAYTYYRNLIIKTDKRTGDEW
jgi:acyl carrier protein